MFNSKLNGRKLGFNIPLIDGVYNAAVGGIDRDDFGLVSWAMVTWWFAIIYSFHETEILSLASLKMKQ